MKTKKFLLLTALLLSFGCFDAMAQKDLLYVADNNPPGPEDSATIAAIEEWGFNVFIVNHGSFSSNYGEPAAYAAFDGVILAESISSGNGIVYQDANFPLPCLNMEGFLPRSDKWGWVPWEHGVTEDYWYANPNRDLDGLICIIVDTTHYITQDYAIDQEVAWSAETDAGVLGDQVGTNLSEHITGAIPLAKSKSAAMAGLHNLWAIPEGTMVPGADGDVAVPRMVHFYNARPSLAPEAQTDGYRNIIKRSIEWMLGMDALIHQPDHHWPLTADLNDVVGTAHGTDNGVTFQDDPAMGPVAHFDGSGYANLPSVINGMGDSLSIACWWRMDESQVWARIYTFGMGDQSEPKDVLMVIPVSGATEPDSDPPHKMFRFTLSDPAGWIDADFTRAEVDVATDTWYFSCIVLMGDSTFVYHNDMQLMADSGLVSRSIGDMTDTENALGKSFWPDALWKGALSDLRIWNSALTEDEVMELYEDTKPSAPPGVRSEPDHHWPLTADLNDVVGTAHGTDNGVTFADDPLKGPVAQFDGSGYANLPSVINGMGDDLSIACWWRMDESQVWARIYTFGMGDQSEPKDVLMVIPVSGATEPDSDPPHKMYRFTLSDPAGWIDADFTQAEVDVAADSWYFSCVVLTEDSTFVYHNDMLLLAEPGLTSRSIGEMTDSENALGKSFWPDALWKGALSDLRVWNSALPKSEVMALYKETKPPAPPGVRSEPDHHWPLTADLNDVVGTAHGTDNGVTFQDDPAMGPVALFDGSGYANLPSVINGMGDDLSIACWWRMDESQVWARIYTFGMGDQSEPKDVLMVIPVSGATEPDSDPPHKMYRFTLSDPAGWIDADFTKAEVDVALDTWYFSCVVLKGDSTFVYHDDMQLLADSGLTSRSIGDMTDTENALGKSFWPDALWKGALSDLRVWNSALPKAEVMALYEETMPASGTGITSQGIKNAPIVYSYLDKISVRLQEPYTDEVASVYNITGALVAKRPVPELYMESFDTGIYIVNVTGSKVNYVTKTIVSK